MTCLPQATGMFSAQGPFDCADFKGGVGWRPGGCEADTRSPRAFPGVGAGCRANTHPLRQRGELLKCSRLRRPIRGP